LQASLQHTSQIVVKLLDSVNEDPTNVGVQNHLATGRGKIIVGMMTDEAVGDEHAEELLRVKVLSHEKQG